MALLGIALETLVSEPDALTTRPPRLIRVVWENFQGIHQADDC